MSRKLNMASGAVLRALKKGFSAASLERGATKMGML